jgi:hypothetical protein
MGRIVCGHNDVVFMSRLRRSRPAQPQSARPLFQDSGPGLVTGAADDDPSGIATYSVAGAALGYGAALDGTGDVSR